MSIQEERELAMRIRMALLAQSQSEVSRLAANNRKSGVLPGGSPIAFGEAVLAAGAL